MLIAVDGPAASGKGTLASQIAEHYGLPHLDTGLLYRQVGRLWIPHEAADDAEARAVEIARDLDTRGLDPDSLGTPENARAASKVAVFPGVRQALLRVQRDFALQPGGAILDGRDIGTVIAPDADVKIFVTASPEIRAGRRQRQFEKRGQAVDFAALLADIKERDARDSSRKDAPLRQADDAYLLDTSDLSIEATLRAAVEIIDTAMAHKAGA